MSLENRARLEGRQGLLAQALEEWLFILVTWLVLAFAASVPLVFLLVYGFALAILAGRFHALGVILHDGIHSFEISRRRSGWLALLAGYPITTTPEAMRFHHLRHHRHFGTANDPYLKSGSKWIAWSVTSLKGCTLVLAWSIRPFVGLAVLALRGLGANEAAEAGLRVYGRGFLQAKELDPSTRQELETCLKAEKGQALFFVAVGALSIWQSAWMFAAYWLPLWFAGFINVWRVYLEHDHEFRRMGALGHDEAGESGDTRRQVWRSTESVALYRIVRPLRWILAPRNIGYHQAHHLSPTTRLQDLPRLHQRFADDFEIASDSRFPVKSGVVHDAVLSVPVLEDTQRTPSEGTRRDPVDHTLVP